MEPYERVDSRKKISVKKSKWKYKASLFIVFSFVFELMVSKWIERAVDNEAGWKTLIHVFFAALLSAKCKQLFYYYIDTSVCRRWCHQFTCIALIIWYGHRGDLDRILSNTEYWILSDPSVTLQWVQCGPLALIMIYVSPFNAVERQIQSQEAGGSGHGQF